MNQWSMDMPANPSMLPLVRQWVREVLAHSPLRYAVELVVSEYVTNTIRHSKSGQGGMTRVELAERVGGPVRVEVIDDGPRDLEGVDWTVGDAQDFGRGLTVVGHLSVDWGDDKDHDGRHRAWAVVEMPL